jgi:hypothetical protein
LIKGINRHSICEILLSLQGWVCWDHTVRLILSCTAAFLIFRISKLVCLLIMIKF